MKRMALFLLILPGIAMLCADDLVTRKGKVFSDYKIVEVAPIGIRITYQKEKKTRTATILFKELTDEFLEHYPGKDPVEREIFAASLDKRKKIRVLEEKRDARLEALEESEESLKERKLSPERRKQLRSRIREEKKKTVRSFHQACAKLDAEERARVENARKKAEPQNDVPKPGK